MKQGEAVCEKCAGLPNDQNFIGRVCGLITDMDMAEYLHAHMFNSESVEKMEETLRESANCKYRCKTTYNVFFKLSLEKLHHKVRCCWGGRAAHKLTASLELFAAQYVRPCLDTDPNAPLKSASLDRLLDFASNESELSQADRTLVKSIVTGDISRHPLIHGLLQACMARISAIDRGGRTIRNPHRTWVAFKKSVFVAFILYIRFFLKPFLRFGHVMEVSGVVVQFHGFWSNAQGLL